MLANPIPAQFAFDSSGNVTGLTGPSGHVLLRPPAPINTRKGAAFKGYYGRRIALWSGAALQNSGGVAALVATSDLPPVYDSATKVLQLTQDASQSFGQVICETSDYTSPTAAVENVGIWAKNTGTATLGCALTLYNAAGNHNCVFYFAVDPGDWRFLTISPKSIVAGGTFVWGTDGIHYIRVAQRDTTETWPAGAVCNFGPLYVGTKGRARLMICSDDGIDCIYQPYNQTVPDVGTGRSIREIVEAYGFKGTLYIISGLVGTAGYIRQADLLRMQDIGWAIGGHGTKDYNYNNIGMGSLGPVGYADGGNPFHAFATNDDTAIYNDVESCITSLKAMGIYNPDYLFALPQGAWDAYVRSGLMRSGVKHVRGTSLATNYHTIAIGQPSGANNTASSLVPGGWIAQADGVQMDGSLTLGDCTGYIDDCITYGASGTAYIHSLGSGAAAKLDGVCSYAATKVAAGSLEVVTATQAAWDDGLI
jgi:hypothetical protein